MSGFTMAYNPVLRDRALSLTAKGLYLVISSFIGMPRWSLTKGTLAKYCESRYALEKAWRELQTTGYLKHRFFQLNGTGSFVHIYDLLQVPDDIPAYQYTTPCDRHNGDCRLVPASDTPRDFTRIPNTVLRSTALPLAVKGLFAVVSHLAHIPNFCLHPEGVKSFCVERLKRFSSVWQHLKISGLLKQHRYPTGEDNGFTYSYDLLNEPDQETPYLTNHHADGSVSSEKTIADYLERTRKKLKSLRTAVCAAKPRQTASNVKTSIDSLTATSSAYTPSEAERNDIGERIGSTYLKQSHDPALVDLIVDALAVIANAPQLTISKREIPLAQRAELVRRVSHDQIAHFISTEHINLSRAKNPAAYLRTLLYAWLQKQVSRLPECCPDTFEWCDQRQQQSLSEWDKEWLQRVQEVRMRRHMEQTTT